MGGVGREEGEVVEEAVGLRGGDGAEEAIGVDAVEGAGAALGGGEGELREALAEDGLSNARVCPPR